MASPAQISREQLAVMFPRASKSVLEANACSNGAVSPCPEPPPKRGRKINKTEAEYERMLQAQFPDATIRYEAYTLKLAEGCRYTPDFAVEHPDGTIEFHETKGAFIFSKALVKPKTAAELFPHRFVLAQKIKGEWTITELPGQFTKKFLK